MDVELAQPLREVELVLIKVQFILEYSQIKGIHVSSLGIYAPYEDLLPSFY